MAKESGLGDACWVDGVDLSGDTGSLGAIGGGPSPLEVTGIDKSAFERLGGLLTGRIDWSAWFNPDRAHASLSTLPTTNRIVTYARGTSLGGPAASMAAKQIGYDPTRGQDGSLTIALQSLSTGWPLEWGELLTAGIETFASADAGSGVDYGASVGTTNFGLSAYLHVFGIDSGSATVTIQDSDDDGSGDAYANVTDAAFAAASAVGSERIQTGATQAVKRWLRINVTGTFTNLDAAVVVTRHRTASL